MFSLFSESPNRLYRFIDDVDMKWTQSDEELQNFLSRANNLHRSIKFTHEISNTTISFLDTSSSLSESTDLYSIPTPINTFCLTAVILLMWLRAYHTVKLLESGKFAQPTNLRKNDWVNLKSIWKEGVINKVLSRKVLTKLITSPGAVYFSTKKNRIVKEPLASSHTIPVWETALTPFVGIGHPSKNIQTVQSISWASYGCLQTIKQSEKPVGAGRNVKA